MSEYQYVHFMAIDRPLDDKQLDFMQQQSSRAEITRWSFANEYNYGDFHGNAREMLRRGYDIHLHYANFGIRKLMIRLPGGLPCDEGTFGAFRSEYGLDWVPDKKGFGGILEVQPEADAGTYDEELWDVAELLPKIAPIREQLMGGDLRPLYLAWLACWPDDDAMEPPVPAGLGQPTGAMNAMATLYAIDDDLLSAAAQQSPPLSKLPDVQSMLAKWIGRQSAADLRKLVGRFLGGDTVAARVETLARIREEAGTVVWPMGEPTRTAAQLRELAETVREDNVKRSRKAEEAALRKRLAAIAADPDKTIANVEKLVKERSVSSYQQAASELVDLREALGPELGPKRARAVAENLRRANPQLKQLIGALRKQGLLA